MEYNGKYRVGDIVKITCCEMVHEIQVVDVWNDEGKNGVTIVPTGNYGFEVDLYEDKFDQKKVW